MFSPVRNMTVIRYYRDGRHWDTEEIACPSWSDAERAIRRMDNYCFPIVQLNTTDDEEDEGIFNICGGDGRWALFHRMGDWQYEEPGGSEHEVRLWDSDQGYFCREKNVLTDIEKVLRITKKFIETGSYATLESVQ
jgi:hypothetical protein